MLQKKMADWSSFGAKWCIATDWKPARIARNCTI